MGHFLSRQRCAKDNCLYVECAVGGPKVAGKDILPPKYEGEQKNLVDPREAISIAEKIYKKWSLDYHDEGKRLRIVGKDMNFVFDFSTKGITAARAWADKVHSGMNKCGHCSKVMGNRDPFVIDDLPNSVFCTEVCLALKYKHLFGVEAPAATTKKAAKKKP